MSNLVRSARWQGVWVADGKVLKPARGATGGPVPSERSIDLPGYPGGRDRVGNRLTNQRQLDNLGEILLLLAAAARSDRMNVDHWRAAEVTVEAIGQTLGRGGLGIWEHRARRWNIPASSLLRAPCQVKGGTVHWGSKWSALAHGIVADADRDSRTPPAVGNAHPRTTGPMGPCSWRPSGAQSRRNGLITSADPSTDTERKRSHDKASAGDGRFTGTSGGT